MTSEKLKPTPGPWVPRHYEGYMDPNWVIIWPGKGGLYSNQLDSLGYFHGDDARLIAEAGTVFHECGLSPRELLEGYRDMYMELREIAQYPENDTVEMRRIARAALAKHKEV